MKITMRWRGYFTLFLFPCMLLCATFLHPFPDFYIRSLALLLLYGIAAILHVSLEICYVPCNFQQKTLLCVWYVPFSGNFIHATTNFFTTYVYEVHNDSSGLDYNLQFTNFSIVIITLFTKFKNANQIQIANDK